jgi:hypothetical protein
MCCEVAFYESGRLKCGRLARHLTIGGVKYYEYVYLYEDGTLRSSKLSDDTQLHGLQFHGGHYVDFDREGRVVAGCLVEERPGMSRGSFVRVEPGRAPARVLAGAEIHSWESGREGCMVDRSVFSAWTQGPFGGAGGECTFRDFLQGSLNEVCQRSFPEYPRILEIIEERHAAISDVQVEMKLIL